MTANAASERRRQFCPRCGQLMFEYFCSPDGHFGLVDEITCSTTEDSRKIRCPTCGARYRVLERLDSAGRPVVRG
jgi:hypothetical protein